jgi:hypothetical protein
MGEFLPDYRRGESIIGYSSRCAANSNLVKNVPLPSMRYNICKDHASQIRKAINQPFDDSKKKSK